MDFPKDFEIQGPWVPVTPTKPIPTKRSPASSSDWLGSGDVGMNGGPGNSWGPSNWRQAAAASPSEQMRPCSSNGGEMQTQSFNHPMQMSYRTLLALSDPAITSNMNNLAPLLLAQMAGHGSGSQMVPPASPNQNQLVARERSSQMMPPASPIQNQLAQLVPHERSSQMMPPASPIQNQLVAHERSSQMMPPASSIQNQLAQLVARERSSQMMPPASPIQNQLAQLVARERSSPMIPSSSPNQNQLAQLVARERRTQMMPPASPNQNQLAQVVAHERSSQMMPPASPNQNQLARLAQLIARERSRQMMPPASPNQNQLAACERSSQMVPPASPRQNQFFLNGNAVPASSNSSSNNWPPQPMASKAQYGLPIPPLPNLNSEPETHMINTVVSKSVVSPETPAHLGKNTRTQDFRAIEIIDLVDDTAMSQNNQQNSFCQQTAAEEALLSFSSPGMSSNIVALQQQEGEMNITPQAEISLQQAEEDNPAIDLNKTPEPKPKRKKHRPKVIREGKAAKTPKPVTPKPVTPRRAKKTEDPPKAKRKYVRKKKDQSSVENPSEPLGENANPQNGNGSKPVRRSLNFDTENCQARDDGAGPEKFTNNAGPQAVISSSNTKSDVQSVQGRGMGTVENPLGAGNSFDLNSSKDQLQNEHLGIPQTPNPPPQHSRQEMMRANQIQAEYIRMLNNITLPPQNARREGENIKKFARMNNHLNSAGNYVISSEAGQNQSASDKTYGALLKGTKRDRSLVDDAQISGHTSQMHAYNGMNRSSENCDTSRNDLCSSEIYKRLRTENMQNEGTSNAYSTFTCNPGSPKTVQKAQNTSKAFTFADAQRFMVYEKLRAFERMLAYNQAAKTAKDIPSQATSAPLKAVVDYQWTSTPVKPSGHNIAGSYQPSTPEKPPEFTPNHDFMSIGPQARIEALIASNKSKPKVRGRKRKEQVPVNPMSSESKISENEAASSTTEFSHGQESLSTYSSTKNANGNSSHLQISCVQDSQGTVKPKGPLSRNTQLGAVVPYGDPIDELIRRLSRLNINGGNKKVTVQQQNALVPYVGGVGPMVVFEGKKRKPRPKVDLDPESDRVWRLLMGREVEGDAEKGADKEKWWEEERRVFRGRAESFIARMHLVQGDRRFSKWKGSVVDSVIGVFLTQNVSDHLSSSAFMSLVAKFPAWPSGSNNTTNLENISRTVASNDTLSGEGKMSEQQSCDPSSVVIHEGSSADEKEMTSSNEYPESNTGSSASDYLGINNVNSLEVELGIGHESPGSGSATAVTVTSSTSGIEGEDRSSMEDVVSSQNSVASQNFSKYHVQMADQGKLNSLLNFDSDDLLSGGIGNGFNSFTELLKMANSGGLQDLNGPGNGKTLSTEHGPAINQFRNVSIDPMPSLPNPQNYRCGAGPSIYTSNSYLQSIQSDFRSSSYPSLSSYYENCLSSNFMGLENAGTVEGNLSNASPAASGIDKTNRTEVMGRQCSPSAENSTKGMDHPLLASSVASVDIYEPIKESSMQPRTSLGSEIRVEMHSSCQSNVVKETIQASDRTCYSKLSLSGENKALFQQREREATWKVESTQHGVKAEGQMENRLTSQTCLKEQSNNDKNQETVLEGVVAVEPNLRKDTSSSQKVSEASKKASKAKKAKQEIDKKKSFDWDSLRKQACCDGAKKERSSDAMDSLDYEALRNADVNVISHTIRERGMNNMLAERIKEFLNRLVKDHGSTDLEWLRDVPPDKAKDYLLSIRGLGLKSVECVRLLTLHHLAFPVDTNVGRICVRLGWVPLQPLPESLQLHLLEMYPILETIQKYLWPRLCKLDQRTLYELHYQLITFGKVFCTKSKPNCNACPMRAECKHFASAFASARLALPGPEEKGLVSSRSPSFPEGSHAPIFKTVPFPQLEGSTQAQYPAVPRNCEPIIEEPASPEPECVEALESAIEDDFFNDPDEIPTIKLNMEEFTQNLQSYMQQNNIDLQDGDMSNALVAITPDSASIPMPKLKNVSRLRTEHQVYELPDSHPLLEGLDKRERDDPSPYLLAIWTPGETAQSTEAPKVCCDSQDTGNLCMAHDCFSCNSIREAKAQLVRGTILIPCRTAMRGSFPLNGTYFQVNEVFADHDSSRIPIDVPRNWIWNLPRRTVYFGTSVTTIFKGLTTEGIQQCFWRGFVCVRGFDRTTRSPKPLYARLHFPASKATKDKRATAEAKEKNNGMLAKECKQVLTIPLSGESEQELVMIHPSHT